MRGPGLAHLRKLPALERLRLGVELDDASLEYLKGFPSLRNLNLSDLKITDAGMPHLAELAGLETLSLFNTQVTDKGLAHLTSLPRLRNLGIRKRPGNKTRITDAGMVHLARIKSLEHLDLPNEGVTDRGLELLSGLDRLKYLWACGRSDSPLSDKALRHVCRLRSLETLKIGGTDFTDAGICHLRALPNLKELNLFTAPQLTNTGLAELGKLETLQTLRLPYGTKVSIRGLANLNGLHRLRCLNISAVAQDGSGLDISGLTGLTELWLSLKGTRVGDAIVHDHFRDEDLACLAQLTRLEVLQLWPCNGITDAGMAHLAGLTDMERLTIGGSHVTDDGLRFVSGMRSLNSLWVAGDFTDQGLHHLEGLKGLVHLQLTSPNAFSRQALDRLLKALPNLQSKGLQVKTKQLRTGRKVVQVGDAAPAFEIETFDGRTLRLSDYRGKVLLLHFWATWCRPCVAAAPGLKQAYAQLAKYEDFAMISLSMDGATDLPRAHIRGQGFAWPQAFIGRDSQMAADYIGEDHAPVYVLIGRDGKIVQTGAADLNAVGPVAMELLEATPKRSANAGE